MQTLKPVPEYGIITDKQRRMLLVFRQCLLMALAAIEEYLEMPRSVEPKHKRKAA